MLYRGKRCHQIVSNGSETKKVRSCRASIGIIGWAVCAYQDMESIKSSSSGIPGLGPRAGVILLRPFSGDRNKESLLTYIINALHSKELSNESYFPELAWLETPNDYISIWMAVKKHNSLLHKSNYNHWFNVIRITLYLWTSYLHHLRLGVLLQLSQKPNISLSRMRSHHSDCQNRTRTFSDDATFKKGIQNHKTTLQQREK
ncbi:unnamed protein product [Vicia faba]|uniref:Uncharacterized protein n=1 Tax=Vicia faba TaxID=3906 RepID=A0AAV0YNI2_VICFA|nr:unnamed protein product [Vicia faba]